MGIVTKGDKGLDYPDYSILINPRGMVNFRIHNRPERQRPIGGNNLIYLPMRNVHYVFNDRIIKMAQTKLLIWVCDYMGLGFVLLGITKGLVEFIDNTRMVLAFIIGITYLGFRVYFFIMKGLRDKRAGEIDLEEKEMALRDRIKKQLPKL